MRVSKKFYLVIALLSSSQLKASCADVLTIERLNDYSSSLYNSLVTPEAADHQLKSNDRFDEFLAEAMELIETEKQELGLRLIHRHGTVKQDEKMVEEFTFHKGAPAFVTSQKSLNSKAFPASWIIDGGSLKVFEYSTDERVQQNIDVVLKNPSALEGLIKLISKFKLENVLAPAIVGRSVMGQFDKGKSMLERTYNNPFRSVVNAEALNDTRAIQTLWSLSRSDFCYEGLSGCYIWDDTNTHIQTAPHSERPPTPDSDW